MRKVGHPDAHRINVLPHLIKHFTEILKLRHVRKFFEDIEGVRCPHIHVAEGDDGAQAGGMEGQDIVLATVADATTGEAHFVAGLARRLGKQGRGGGQ